MRATLPAFFSFAFRLFTFALNRVVVGLRARVKLEAVFVAALDLVEHVEFFVVLEVDADGVCVLFNVGLVGGGVVAAGRLCAAVVDIFPRGVEVGARVLGRGGGVVSEALGEEVGVFGRAPPKQ